WTLTRTDRVVYAFAQLRLVARQPAALLPIATDASAASSTSTSGGRRGWRERRLKRLGARPRSLCRRVPRLHVPEVDLPVGQLLGRTPLRLFPLLTCLPARRCVCRPGAAITVAAAG